MEVINWRWCFNSHHMYLICSASSKECHLLIKFFFALIYVIQFWIFLLQMELVMKAIKWVWCCNYYMWCEDSVKIWKHNVNLCKLHSGKKRNATITGIVCFYINFCNQPKQLKIAWLTRKKPFEKSKMTKNTSAILAIVHL